MPVITDYLGSNKISSMGICGLLGFISSYFVGLMPETKDIVMNSCIEKLLEL